MTLTGTGNRERGMRNVHGGERVEKYTPLWRARWDWTGSFITTKTGVVVTANFFELLYRTGIL